MKTSNKKPLPISFDLDVSKIKVAGSESDISKTIEELLALNNRIPKRWDEEPKCITEKQFDESKHTENKKLRNKEKMEILEALFEHDDEPDENPTVIENKLRNTSGTDGGHREDGKQEKVRGHKDIQPIWREVYRLEDERKKLDKGQLKKKI